MGNLNGADEAKLNRMIDAAISEFALRGYKNANTNRIVEKAGVSKGLLFHYFGNKKELYLYLYNYAMDLVVSEYMKKADRNEKDIFNRCRAAIEIKFALMRKNSMLFEFILDAYARTDDEVKNSINRSTLSWITSGWDRLIEGADLSLFREDIDPRKAVEIISWCIEGYSNKWLDPPKMVEYYEERYEELVSGLEMYLAILRKVFYK